MEYVKVISSWAWRSESIATKGRIWGGETAKIDIIKSLGLVFVKPKIMPSASDILDRIL